MTTPLVQPGDRFGRLVVVGRAAVPPRTDGRYWDCVCDCGGAKVTRTSALRGGLVSSCGCRRREAVATMSAEKVTHGHSTGGKTSPTYNSWASMIGRCTNPANIAWERYGGRGVTVADAWRAFPAFLADMGERPVGTSLDRIDNERGYEPGNCRWATPKQQAANRRPARR